MIHQDIFFPLAFLSTPFLRCGCCHATCTDSQGALLWDQRLERSAGFCHTCRIMSLSNAEEKYLKKNGMSPATFEKRVAKRWLARWKYIFSCEKKNIQYAGLAQCFCWHDFDVFIVVERNLGVFVDGFLSLQMMRWVQLMSPWPSLQEKRLWNPPQRIRKNRTGPCRREFSLWRWW